MKKNFQHLTIRGLLPPGLVVSTVHCTRCGKEYPSLQLQYGYRVGEEDAAQIFCVNDDCYGRFPQDIYEVKVTDENGAVR